MNSRLSAAAFMILWALAAAAAFLILPSLKLEGSVLSLLPDRGGATGWAAQAYLDRLDSSLYFMIEDDGDGSAARAFARELEAIPGVASATCGGSDLKKAAALVAAHPGAFLAPSQVKALASEGRSRRVLAMLYSGFSGLSPAELGRDPLLASREAGLSMARGQKLVLMDGIPSAKDDEGRIWRFVSATLSRGGFDASSSETAKRISALCAGYAKKHGGALKRGTLFYSQAAAAAASGDLARIGIVSSVLVLAVILVAFGSMLPVILTLLSIASGLTAGFLAVALCYHGINLIITGMCLSVIGVVADYTIYYCAIRQSAPSLSPSDAMAKMRRPLLFASLTDVAAYLIIIASPARPLRELALFCAVAVTVSCLFVIMAEPALLRMAPRQMRSLGALCSMILKAASRRLYAPLAIGAAVALAAYGATTLKANDDPASFQEMPSDLRSDEARISDLTGQGGSQSFITIEAGTDDAMLSRLSQMRSSLIELESEGAIKGFAALPLWDTKTQEQNLAILNEAGKAAALAYSSSGIKASFKGYQDGVVTLAQFEDSPLGAPWKALIAREGGKVASAVSIDGMHDRAALLSAVSKIEGATLIDRRHSVEGAFSHFRHLIIWVLAAFAFVIAISLSLRLGIRRGIAASALGLLSAGAALGGLASTGMQLNLFSELALVLVLGIGVNYLVFFSSAAFSQEAALRGILTALLTTLAGVGMLSISSVAAVRGFAVTLSCGITASFLLALALPSVFRLIGASLEDRR